MSMDIRLSTISIVVYRCWQTSMVRSVIFFKAITKAGSSIDRLRHELIHSNEPHLTLADLAMRWGFAHQGRFSAEYRSRFGETPGETLQRVRGGQH